MAGEPQEPDDRDPTLTLTGADIESLRHFDSYPYVEADGQVRPPGSAPSPADVSVTDLLHRVGDESPQHSYPFQAQPVPRSHRAPAWALIAGCVVLLLLGCTAALFALRGGGSGKVSPTSAAAPAGLPAAIASATAAPTDAASSDEGEPVAGQSYHLRNVVTGKCMGLLKGEVRQYVCADGGKAEQVWRLEPTRVESGVQFYWLRLVSGSTNCLDLPNYGAEPQSTELLEFTCTEPADTDNQEWALKEVGRTDQGLKQYAVVNKASDLCIDVANWAADKTDRPVGQRLGIYQCHAEDWGWDDHLWVFQ